MVKIVVVNRAGDANEVEAEQGLSLMEVIRDNGFDELLALCGGCCSCATCHVYVDEAWSAALPPMSEDEDDLLSTSGAREGNSRLSCQIPFGPALDGIEVTVAPED